MHRGADYGSRSFRGRNGFYFLTFLTSLTQCDNIENMGPVPWDTVWSTLPRWDKITEAVESSWTTAKLPQSWLISHLAPPVQRINPRRDAPASHHHWPICTMLCSQGGIQAFNPLVQKRSISASIVIGLDFSFFSSLAPHIAVEGRSASTPIHLGVHQSSF